MEKNKLTELLNSLELKQKVRFQAYLSSPLYNKSTKLIRLIQFILEHDSDMIEKRKAFTYVYGNKKYNDGLMRYLQSKLHSQLQNFILLEESHKDDFENSHHLLSYLRQKNLDKHFSHVLNDVQKKHKVHLYRDAAYLQNEHLLEAEYNRFLIKNSKRSNVTNLQNTMDSLDRFYIYNKLKYCCEILNYKHIVSVDYKLLLIDEILEHLKVNAYKDDPGISIYYNILMTLQSIENEGHFRELKELLIRHSGKFRKEEIRGMYIFAQNYCIKMITNGREDYQPEIFELYKLGLGKDIMIEDNVLSPWYYKNIVTVGLRLKQFDWVEEFIKQYNSFLPEDQRKNAMTFNLAHLHFYKGDYRNVLKLLQTVEYNDVFYGLDSRAILLKTYYEMDEIQSLHSLIDSFRIFLKRNRLVSQHHKTLYLNLLRFVRRLSNISPGDTVKSQRLRKAIKETKQIADSAWLLSKVV